MRLEVAWYFDFPQRLLRILCGYFAQARGGNFENSISDPVATITAILPSSGWLVLLLRIVTRDAVARLFKLNPEVRWKVYVDDIKLHLTGKSPNLPAKIHEVFDT